jgi:hypothetical protein
VLVVLPRGGCDESVVHELSGQLHLQPNVIAGLESNMTICVEASGLSVGELGVELVQRRRDRVDFAGRVQSRNDIAWTPLVVEPAEAPISTWVELEHTPALPESFAAKTMVLER